jgi:hypothetical protein
VADGTCGLVDLMDAPRILELVLRTLRKKPEIGIFAEHFVENFVIPSSEIPLFSEPLAVSCTTFSAVSLVIDISGCFVYLPQIKVLMMRLSFECCMRLLEWVHQIAPEFSMFYWKCSIFF